MQVPLNPGSVTAEALSKTCRDSITDRDAVRDAGTVGTLY